LKAKDTEKAYSQHLKSRYPTEAWRLSKR